MEALPDIICGAAHEGTLAALLEELGEGRFDKGGGGAEKGGHPHPEYGAGASDCNRRGNAGKVSGADPAGKGDSKGLEGGNVFLAFFSPGTGVRQKTEHVRNHAELHKAGLPCKEKSAEEQGRNQEIGPQAVCDRGEKGFHKALFFREEHRIPGREKGRFLIEEGEKVSGNVFLLYHETEHVLVEPLVGWS